MIEPGGFIAVPDYEARGLDSLRDCIKHRDSSLMRHDVEVATLKYGGTYYVFKCVAIVKPSSTVILGEIL